MLDANAVVPFDGVNYDNYNDNNNNNDDEQLPLFHNQANNSAAFHTPMPQQQQQQQHEQHHQQHHQPFGSAQASTTVPSSPLNNAKKEDPSGGFLDDTLFKEALERRKERATMLEGRSKLWKLTAAELVAAAAAFTSVAVRHFVDDESTADLVLEASTLACIALFALLCVLTMRTFVDELNHLSVLQGRGVVHLHALNQILREENTRYKRLDFRAHTHQKSTTTPTQMVVQPDGGIAVVGDNDGSGNGGEAAEIYLPAYDRSQYHLLYQVRCLPFVTMTSAFNSFCLLILFIVVALNRVYDARDFYINTHRSPCTDVRRFQIVVRAHAAVLSLLARAQRSLPSIYYTSFPFQNNRRTSI
jgi:hypothetical protein